MKVRINPLTDALLIVDATKTFMPGGGLAIIDGDLIIPTIEDIISLFVPEKRIATLDKHKLGSICLASSYNGLAPRTFLQRAMPNYLAPHALFSYEELTGYLLKTGGQVLWEDHGMGEEAELHPSLQSYKFGFILHKGLDPKCDSYSAFFDNLGRPTGLAEELRRCKVKRVFICGLALDYCVGWSAEGARREGFEVFVIEDATRPVGYPADSVEKIFESFTQKGIQLVQSTDLTL
ncbi:isochorismatase family protein [Candidatus Parcubacteria bacterium]|nr:isochorismatase family protein [Candidatus Parcubacteria bacterium]